MVKMKGIILVCIRALSFHNIEEVMQALAEELLIIRQSLSGRSRFLFCPLVYCSDSLLRDYFLRN